MHAANYQGVTTTAPMAYGAAPPLNAGSRVSYKARSNNQTYQAIILNNAGAYVQLRIDGSNEAKTIPASDLWRISAPSAAAAFTAAPAPCAAATAIPRVYARVAPPTLDYIARTPSVEYISAGQGAQYAAPAVFEYIEAAPAVEYMSAAPYVQYATPGGMEYVEYLEYGQPSIGFAQPAIQEIFPSQPSNLDQSQKLLAMGNVVSVTPITVEELAAEGRFEEAQEQRAEAMYGR